MNYQVGTYKFVKQPNQHKGKFLFRVKKHLLHLIKLLGGMTATATLIALIFMAGQYSVPEHISAITTFVQDKTKYPVLERIAGCESEGNRNSKGSQFDSKGVLRKHVNEDKTVDIGKNMINSYYWELKAVELGYNIYTEEGNDKMAMWLYVNKGTGDWKASFNCWK